MEQSLEIKRIRTVHAKVVEAKKAEAEQVVAAALTVEEKKAQFFKDLKKSTDLNDNL